MIQKLSVYLVLLTLFSGFFARAQDIDSTESFDKAYYNIAVNMASRNPAKALKLSDSLFDHAPDYNRKIKALMLSASILTGQEKRLQGIKYMKRALALTKSKDDYGLQARIYAFLSTQYRTMGFFDRGKSYIKKGIVVSTKMKKQSARRLYHALANHELAEYALENDKFQKAFDLVKGSVQTYKKQETGRRKDLMLAGAYELMGRALVGEGHFESALLYFRRTERHIIKAGAAGSLSGALIYKDLGHVFLRTQKSDSAGIYLQRALAIFEPGHNNSLKQGVYRYLTEYYRRIQAAADFKRYAYKYDSIVQYQQNRKKTIINGMADFRIDQTDPPINKTWYWAFAILILMLGSVLLYRNRKRSRSKALVTEYDTDTAKEGNNSIALSDEAIKLLNEKMVEFEGRRDYLDKTISFSSMTGELETNSKYLHIFFKKVVKKDFRTYINDLRIGYLVEKLENDPDWRKYKGTHVAQKCGFASYSAFSANFKRVTGSPFSEFVKKLK